MRSDCISMRLTAYAIHIYACVASAARKPEPLCGAKSRDETVTKVASYDGVCCGALRSGSLNRSLTRSPIEGGGAYRDCSNQANVVPVPMQAARAGSCDRDQLVVRAWDMALQLCV